MAPQIDFTLQLTISLSIRLQSIQWSNQTLWLLSLPSSLYLLCLSSLSPSSLSPAGGAWWAATGAGEVTAMAGGTRGTTGERRGAARGPSLLRPQLRPLLRWLSSPAATPSARPSASSSRSTWPHRHDLLLQHHRLLQRLGRLHGSRPT